MRTAFALVVKKLFNQCLLLVLLDNSGAALQQLIGWVGCSGAALLQQLIGWVGGSTTTAAHWVGWG